MNLDAFAKLTDDLERRLAVLRSAPGRTAERLEDADEVLRAAIRQLRGAADELRRRDDRREAAHETATAGRRGEVELFDSAPVAYLVTGPDGRIVEANRAADELLGPGPGDLAGRDLGGFLVVDDRPAFRGALGVLARGGRLRAWDARLLRAEGAPRPVVLAAAAWPGWEGEAMALRWIVREAEAAPDEPARLRALIDGVDGILWESGPDGRCRFVSRQAEELLGYPVERWLAEAGLWHAIVHVEDRKWAEARRRQCLDAGADQELEYRLVAADGRVVWVRESIRVARDDQGRVAGLRGTMWNIGRRKKVERQLYVARRELAEQLADMTHLHELSRRLWATTELEPLLGEILAAASEIQGAELGVVRLFDPARRELETIASLGLPASFLERYGRASVDEVGCGLAIERGGPMIVEDVEADPAYAPFREAARLGGYRADCCTLLVSRCGETLGTIATYFREPHRPAERQLRLVELFAHQAADFVESARLRRELREADRRKDEALAVLAHELRNPLSVILTAAHAQLPGDADGDGVGWAATCDLIARQARRMARLVDDLFDASRLARGMVELRPEPVDLAAVLDRAVEAVRPLIDQRRHVLTLTPPAEPARLEADPARLEQVLVNLLTNAARYTEPGGRIAVEAGCEGGQAVIRVRDSGVGLAPELLGRVFEPYLQGEPGSERSRGGLGLGLALVRGLVESQGGTVTASSGGLGRGSEFTVTLPLGRPGPVEPKANGRGAAPPARAARARRVLVVDNLADAARSLTRLLAARGHEARVALDGHAALEEAATWPPEVALLDLSMPGMDGCELARQLRSAHGPALRLAAVSGFGRDDDRRRAHEAGFDHFLPKPVVPEDLLRWLGD